jgi:mono/diheme cytochrome c family protein
MTMKKLLLTATAIIATLTFYSFSQIDQSGEWVVPDSAKSVKNPTDADDEENQEIGEELYMKHCKSCHGKEGLGDGPKANEMDGDMGDFSDDDFQAQSDGSLFYKITKGRDDMPNFDKKISDDEDRWLVVNYVRTLGD